MKNEFRQIILYVWVGLSAYYLTKYFFPERPEEPEAPEVTPDSNIDVRGGNLTAAKRLFILKHLRELVLKDQAIKVALISIFAVKANEELIMQLATPLIQAALVKSKLPAALAASSPSMIAASSKNLIELPTTAKDILASTVPTEAKKVVLVTELTNMDQITLSKLKLLIIKGKLKYLFKNLKGKKRIQFILFCIGLISYLASNNTPLFALLSGVIREVLKETPITDPDDYIN